MSQISSDHPASQHELQTFLFSISSPTQLMEILQDLKTSQWWNHMATFLIIYMPTMLDLGCFKGVEILWLAWEMNLLNAKFICHDESKGPLIYSYNPYTRQAPIPWQVEKTFRTKYGHPWTFLVRRYQDGQKICNNLDFNQTKDLDGYEFRAIMNYPKTSLERIIHTMNIELQLFPASSTITIFDPKSVLETICMNDHGITDISLLPSLEEKNMTIRKTYLNWHYGVSFITQHRGNLSQNKKLLRVVDCYSQYAVVLVCFITFVFFKFFIGQSVSSAILNIVRLICNAAVPNLSNNVATRIYLSAVFIFVMILQGIYQGKLASLLTKPVALPNVETFEDLENFNYTIYGNEVVKSYFEKWNYSGRVISVNDSICARFVLRDDSAACVGDRRYLVHIAKKYNLHLSATITHMFIGYFIREDWPLKKRMDIKISRLFESNIIEYVSMKNVESILRNEKFYEKEKENQGFTYFALNDLSFAFAILGIGLAVATIVFFFEVWKGGK